MIEEWDAVNRLREHIILRVTRNVPVAVAMREQRVQSVMRLHRHVLEAGIEAARVSLCCELEA